MKGVLVFQGGEGWCLHLVKARTSWLFIFLPSHLQVKLRCPSQSTVWLLGCILRGASDDRMLTPPNSTGINWPLKCISYLEYKESIYVLPLQSHPHPDSATSELLWLCSSTFFSSNSTFPVSVNTADGHQSSISDPRVEKQVHVQARKLGRKRIKPFKILSFPLCVSLSAKGL